MVWAKRVTLAIWELPQNVLGLALLAAQTMRGNVQNVIFERERVLVELKTIGAVSLGLFVFWTKRDNAYVPVGPENRDHEFGHSVQSRVLGPLYLPIVGVPSELRVLYAVGHRVVTGKRWGRYYNGWPERSADVLGGADVSLRPAP